MSKGNGESKTASDLSVEQKLDVIMEALADLNTRFEVFTEDLVEKLSNLNVEGEDFGVFDVDEFDED